MKAEEIRLGNWVLSLGKDGIWYNSKISKIEVQNIIVGVGFKRKLKPIPLSEDILLKCGFVNNQLEMSGSIWLELKRPNLYKSDLRIAQLSNNEWGITFECVSPSTLILFNLSYLHQLQNFCSVLGKEIEINL